jgi:hypothetical protein
MSADDPEAKQPSEANPAKRTSSCKNPYIEWIFWGQPESPGIRLGIAATIIITLGLLWIVWAVWPAGEWMQPATSAIQTQKDRSACRAIASKLESPVGIGGITRGSKYSLEYKKCMESKGYSLTK